MLEYLQTNYAHIGSQKILSGEYIASGEDEQGGFIIYEVVTEDGKEHIIRVDVVFHKYLTKIGPDYKIRDFYEVLN